MARAPAGEKSRARGSNTISTTASSVKAGWKSAAKTFGVDDWMEEDQAEARKWGWGLFEFIDPKAPRKICLEIEAWSTKFKDDNVARMHVAECGRNGDALALKALRAIFRSKAAMTPKEKK